MITSTLTFYKTNIRAEKNLCIDNINEFLDEIASTQKRVINDFMYVKHGLEIEIKVEIDITAQEHLQTQPVDSATSFGYDYVAIKNSNENKSIYYYVMKCEWRSNGCVRLTLAMDTINSFQEFKSAFTDKTRIIRKHVARFNADDYYHDTENNKIICGRIIDKNDEQLTPLLYKASQEKIIDNTDFANNKFYLFYIADHDLDAGEASNPVACYLIPKNAESFSNGVKSIILGTSNSLTTNLRTDVVFGTDTRDTYLYGKPQIKIGSTYVHNGVTYTIDNFVIYPDFDGTPRGWVLALSLRHQDEHEYSPVLVDYDFTQNLGVDTPFRFVNDVRNIVLRSTTKTIQQIIADGDWMAMSVDFDVYVLGWRRYEQTSLSNAKLVKIIEIPYTLIRWKNDINPNMWAYNMLNGLGALQLIDTHKEFEDIEIHWEKVSELEHAFPITTDATSFINYMKSTDYEEESKLYHSSFYQHKYVYDSFTLFHPLECYTPEQINDGGVYCGIDFKISSTINSKMAFKIYYSPVIATEIRDYPEYLVISRNNEKTIFTSNFLNYLRSGFNYDKKAKDIKNLTTWATTGISLLAGVANVAVGSKTLGATLIAGSVAGVIGSISSTIQSENSFNSKIAQMQEQSANIQTADDIDILNYFADNKLWQMIYKPSTLIRNQLFYLFKYYGYSHPVYEIPDINTHVAWDFLQCEPVFKDFRIGLKELIDEIRSDIQARLKIGVTFIHKLHSSNWDDDYVKQITGGSLWDIDQVSNNLDINVYWLLAEF